MKKIYLHMGFHKTATSSFQATCAKNVDELKRQGFVYPLFSCFDGAPRRNIPNHSIPIFSSFTKDPNRYHVNINWGVKNIPKVNRGYLNTLENCFSEKSNIILSGEGVSHLEASELVEFKRFLSRRGFEIVPIVAVRSPYAFHCAMVQQLVKGGAKVDFTKFVSQREKILKLVDIFGSELEFISFARMCGHEHGPVGHLADCIGLDISKVELINSNEGTSNVHIRIQNALNQKEPAIVGGKINPNHSKISRSTGDKFQLTDEELGVIRNDLERENDFFRERLGNQFCDTTISTSSKISFEQLLSENVEAFTPLAISHTTVDALRKNAIGYEKQKKYRLAYEFMSLAHHGRPDGPLIKRKLLEYENIISAMAEIDSKVCDAQSSPRATNQDNRIAAYAIKKIKKISNLWARVSYFVKK